MIGERTGLPVSKRLLIYLKMAWHRSIRAGSVRRREQVSQPVGDANKQKRKDLKINNITKRSVTDEPGQQMDYAPPFTHARE